MPSSASIVAENTAGQASSGTHFCDECLFRPAARQLSARGFTLLELSLVLAILVVIAALAWPALRGPMESQRLRIAGDRIRTICAAARNRAIVTGQTHVLRCQTGTGQFRLQVYTGGDAALESTSTTSQADGTDGFSQVDLGHDASSRNDSGEIVSELPEGIVFKQSLAEADPRSASIDTSGELAAAGAAGDSPVLFYSDGTTSTAQVTLTDEKGRTISIELRGLTGITRAGPVNNSGGETPR